MPATIVGVIPYYNGSRFIDEAMASVLAQTLPATEVFIVDDGSRSEEAAVLEKYRGSATILRQVNQGAAAARNTGVAASTSEWIAFLDCDDLWAPNHLEVLAHYLQQHPECGAVHNAVQVHDSARIHRKTLLQPEHFLLNAADPSPVMPSAALVRRDIFLRAGMMDPSVRIGEDYDFFLRVALLGPIHYVDEPLTVRRRHEGNVSRDIGVACLNKNRVVVRNRQHYASEREFQRQILRLNCEYLTRAIYRRDWKTAVLAFRLAREQNVSGLSLAASGLSRVIRNRFAGAH